ncbi:50S ribosomal protein L10 [Naumannella cuiyingiana]|uniref:Large ribosomal subunit protein uL10 n=1 Tax=Naumannella cuiyingiana TaxID=1347891 RepID=A0A7Z0IKJ7_9ACTN|nr:50S ribosomal protein L10 [Naumannella cuiyingiana]NYI70522.1 large subunit ribosomal protein L10 [Naumannella cuiyingiana]
MARPDKVATVEELAKRFADSTAVVLTEYRGLSVSALKDLRRSLGDDASYAVTKNTLTQRAAKDAGIEGLDEQLVGPTAIAFINGDVATVAKGLRDFAKANPLLVLKGGVMDGRVLDAAQVTQLANLESREVLLAKLAGGMKGALSNAVSLFAAPLSQAARALGALQTAAEANPDLIAGAGAAPAAEAPAEEAAPEAPADEPATQEPAAEPAESGAAE